MAFEFREREVAEGIGEADDGIEVCDAALFQRFDDPGIFFYDFVEGMKFAGVDRSLDVFALFPGFEFAAGDINQRLNGDAFAQQDYFGFAEDGIAGLPCQDFVLGGFVKQDAMGDGVGVDFAGVAQHVVHGPVFLCVQGVQQMLRSSVLAEKQQRKKNGEGSYSKRPLHKTGHKSSEKKALFGKDDTEMGVSTRSKIAPATANGIAST